MYMSGANGFHIMGEFYGCSPGKIEKASSLKKIMMSAAKGAGFKIVGNTFYQFKPYGATGVVLLATSHMSAHTWPEFGYVAVDIYSCSGKAHARKAVKLLVKKLNPKKYKLREMERFR